MAKFIIILSGGYSSIGKGIISASTLLLLRCRGYEISYCKKDPYCNGPTSQSPSCHGEVVVSFGHKPEDNLDNGVTKEGGGVEVDLDLISVENIVNTSNIKTNLYLGRDNFYNSGMLYKEIIEESERGDYLGETITNKPHLTNKIIKRMEKLAKTSDVLVTEIGGTIDCDEAVVYINAVCELKKKYGNDCLIVLLVPIIYLDVVEEFKTRIAQRAVKDLKSFGISPDMLVCRCIKEIPKKIIEKVSLLTDVEKSNIFVGIDAKCVYTIPLNLYYQNYDDAIVDFFHLKRSICKIHKYKDTVESYLNEKNLPIIKIAVVSKYQNFKEAYISLRQALFHASVKHKAQVEIKWLDAKELEKSGCKIDKEFEGISGIIVPGGFGVAGTDCKIKAIQYAREHKIPFLGLCLGLQLAAIEIAKDLCGLEDANSIEFNKNTKNPIIHFVKGQEELKTKSDNMRLGSYNCLIEDKSSLAYEIYGKTIVAERHRHRYEINPEFIEKFASVGFKVSGKNPGTNLIEMMELDRSIHPFFIGFQSHPEFNSSLMNASPVFCAFVQACLKEKI